jgi:hypothetical protein
MRPYLFAASILAAVAATAAARAQSPQPAPDRAPVEASSPTTPAPSHAPGQPNANDMATSVPTVDVRTLSPSDIQRRNALYGEGWQYRMAPISPGPNSGTPINPEVEVAPTDLTNLDQRIKSDEVTASGLRDTELAREDGVIAAVEPALPWYWRGRQWPHFLRRVSLADFPRVRLPDFRPAADWVRNRF